MSDVSDILAKELIRELKIRKRWSRIFKALTAIVIICFLFFYNKGQTEQTIDTPHTALIKLDGAISEFSENSSDFLAKSLKKAFSNNQVQGIILRINSPGGSPVSSDYIYHEIKRLKEKHPEKKIYAVCSEICASAAYHIACAADEIYANPSSMVGSISVIFDGFGYVGTMEKLGVERRMVTSGKHKGFLDPYSPIVPEQMDKLKSAIDILHNQFIQDVKQGRKNKLKDDPEIFSGLYWPGVRAKELGLIDDFASAGQVAREIIKEPALFDYTVRADYWTRFAEQLNFGSKIMSLVKSNFGDNI